MDEQILHYRRKLEFEIDSWDLKVAREAGERITVIDSRSRQAHAREHIPGAISLPHREMSAASTAGIGRGSLVVTYCDGIGCNASTKGALRMAGLGFRTRELIGGLDWWKRDGHPTEKAREGKPPPARRPRAATAGSRAKRTSPPRSPRR
jgi:rhodanese-related sulfurtransferase